MRKRILYILVLNWKHITIMTDGFSVFHILSTIMHISLTLTFRVCIRTCRKLFMIYILIESPQKEISGNLIPISTSTTYRYMPELSDPEIYCASTRVVPTLFRGSQHIPTWFPRPEAIRFTTRPFFIHSWHFLKILQRVKNSLLEMTV